MRGQAHFHDAGTRYILSYIAMRTPPHPAARRLADERAGLKHIFATLTVLAGLLIWGPARADTQRLLVFAAASQQNALDAVMEAWRRQGGAAVTGVYASSSTLARQIAEGAPADVFISADVQWMDYLERRGLLRPGTRVQLLGNDLVLIAPTYRDLYLKIAPGFDLVSHLHGGKLAMGDPDHVPAGIYGRQALQFLGVWNQVADKVARADDVRAALALVSRGEAPLGVVYGSDAMVDKGVRVAGRFPPQSHSPIIYPAAVIDASKNKYALEFLRFLRSDKAAVLFQKFGFVPLRS